MRVGDLQQIMMQTDVVGQLQQQGAHGAEVEQSRLLARQQEEIKEQEKQVPTLEQSDTVEIRERESRHSRREQQGEKETEEDGREPAETARPGFAPGSSSQAGCHLDIMA